MALRDWVYADESGIHDGAPWCLVAGYRASPRQWKRFDREWRSVLGTPGYGIKVAFHSKDFFNRKLSKNSSKNPYAGWTDIKATKFLDELLTVIRQHKIKAVLGAVDVNAFNSFSYGERCQMVGYAPGVSTMSTRPPAPYHMAVRLMVEDALEETASDTELHFVIAKQKDLQQRALDGYQLTKELWLPTLPERVKRLKGMGVEDPVDFPELQAADLWGYLLYSHLTAGMKPISREKQKALLELTRSRPEIVVATKEGMERIFSNLSAVRRAEIQAMPEPPRLSA